MPRGRGLLDFCFDAVGRFSALGKELAERDTRLGPALGDLKRVGVCLDDVISLLVSVGGESCDELDPFMGGAVRQMGSGEDQPAVGAHSLTPSFPGGLMSTIDGALSAFAPDGVALA